MLGYRHGERGAARPSTLAIGRVPICGTRADGQLLGRTRLKPMDYGSLADWAAAAGTTLAVFATIALYRHDRYLASRDLADSFTTSLRVNHAISVGGPSEHKDEMLVEARNTGRSIITLPIVYVPTEENDSGYRRARLIDDEHSLDYAPGAHTVRYIKVEAAHKVRGRTLVRFRDERNRWWTRYVESGEYLSERKWKKLEKKRPGGETIPLEEMTASVLSPSAGPSRSKSSDQWRLRRWSSGRRVQR